MSRNTRYIEVVLVIGVAVLAGWNYNLTTNNFALPHKVSMYSIKPVLEYDREFGDMQSGDDAVTADAFHKRVFTQANMALTKGGGLDFHRLTPLQVSKFVLGCYGDGQFTSPGWMHVEKYWEVSAQLSAEAMGKYNRTSATPPSVLATRMLDLWQRNANPHASGRQGVCSCIDTLALATASSASRGTPADARYSSMSANMHGLDVSSTSSDTVKTVTGIVEFCHTSAVAVQAVQYEGTVGLPALLFAAQMCILLGLLHVWDLFVLKARIRVQTTNRVNGVSGMQTDGGYRKWGKILLVLLTFVGYFYVADLDYNQFGSEDEKHQSFRSSKYTNAVWSAPNLFIVGSLVVVLVVELVYEFISSHASGGMSRLRYNKNSTMAHVVDRIGADVPLIFGFGLMGVGVMLQAGVSSASTVLGGAFILITAGFLQHVSNVVKILYDSVCTRLSSEVVVGLTLHDERREAKGGPGDNEEVANILKAVHQTAGTKASIKNEPDSAHGNRKVRRVLQFFGWTRLYLFLGVLVLAISFVTTAKDSTSLFLVKIMLDSQLLYFTICFLFAHIGFDMMYELLPMAFDTGHADLTRIYFVCTYLAVFNLNQILYVRGVTLAPLP